MKDFLELCMNVDYADMRVSENTSEFIMLEDGKISAAVENKYSGFGIRVLKNGSFGFSSTSKELNSKNIKECFLTAEKLAVVLSKRQKVKRKIPELKKIKDTFISPFKINPFSVPTKDKLMKLKEIEFLLKKGENIKSSSCFFKAVEEKTDFHNSIGSEISQKFIVPVFGFFAVGRKNDVIQQVMKKTTKCTGYELVENFDIEQNTREAISEINTLLTAGHSPAGRYPVVLDGGMTGLFFHEAVGHACEADAFIKKQTTLEGKEGKKIAAEKVNLSDDGNFKNSSSSYKYDEDGMPAKSAVLIKNGILLGKLHSFESSIVLNEENNGHGRAIGHHYFPIPRMANTILFPGEYKKEELFEGIKKGIYLKNWKAGEVDPKKGTFTYAAMSAFLIENGKITKPLRDVIISGNVNETLMKIEKVSNKIDLIFSGGYCGKQDQSGLRNNSFAPHIMISEAMIGGRNN